MPRSNPRFPSWAPGNAEALSTVPCSAGAVPLPPGARNAWTGCDRWLLQVRTCSEQRPQGGDLLVVVRVELGAILPAMGRQVEAGRGPSFSTGRPGRAAWPAGAGGPNRPGQSGGSRGSRKGIETAQLAWLACRALLPNAVLRPIPRRKAQYRFVYDEVRLVPWTLDQIPRSGGVRADTPASGNERVRFGAGGPRHLPRARRPPGAVIDLSREHCAGQGGAAVHPLT